MDVPMSLAVYHQSDDSASVLEAKNCWKDIGNIVHEDERSSLCLRVALDDTNIECG